MKAKSLGRLELLAWINTLAMSDYPKIENLSDGIAFCHVIDAYYPNSLEFNKLKCKLYNLVNSKNIEDWEKNLMLLNDATNKIKNFKPIDPLKMSKGKFNLNFEYLQFVYDFILKNFPEEQLPKKYNAFERRVSVFRSHLGRVKYEQLRKLLPSFLIPNEVLIRIEKKIDLNEEVEFNPPEAEEPQEQTKENSKVTMLIDKYRDFLSILNEDLRKTMDRNKQMSNEINDIEEERTYYLDKLNNVKKFCSRKQKESIEEDTKKKLEDIVKIIFHEPDDFK